MSEPPTARLNWLPGSGAVRHWVVIGPTRILTDITRSTASRGDPFRDGPAHAGGPAQALEYADHGGGDVDLAGFGPVPRASGIGVVHVVPAFAERHQGERPQVRGAVVAPGGEGAVAEHVAQRVDAQ